MRDVVGDAQRMVDIGWVLCGSRHGDAEGGREGGGQNYSLLEQEIVLETSCVHWV